MTTRLWTSHFLVACLSLLLLIGSGPTRALAASGEVRQVRIGVLAKRGEEQTYLRWRGTARYLEEKLPGYRFTILPLDFDEIHNSVENGDIEFVLANSAFYADLEVRYGVTRLATMKNRHGEKGYTVFAGTIITRADRDELQTLEDLRGKSFMAVDERSFGGFHMAWRELSDRQIDPYRDFSRLLMGGTHDAVVFAVLNGVIDAGTVRSDTLERMAQEGKVKLADFRVLNARSSPQLPFLHSTRLYPEWPFAKVRGVPDALAQKVAIALLQMPEESAVAQTSDTRGWTIPHDYQPVHDCLRELRISPYEKYGQVSTWEAARRLWPWFLFGFILLAVGFLTAIYLLRINRKLTESRLALAAAHRGLEEQVAERTRDLENANRQLLREIEERKLSEQALSEERTKLELITSNLGAGFAVISRDYRTIMANKVIKEMFGEVEGQFCYQSINKRDEVCPDCGVRKLFEEGLDRVSHEQRSIDSEGNEVWSQVIATPLRDESGEITAAIEVGVPITERKRVEQELRQALEEAEEARDKVDNIVKSVINGLIVTDTEGHVVLMNQVAAGMLAADKEQSLGCPAEELFADFALRQEFATFLNSGHAGSTPWEFELRGNADGEQRILRAWASEMRNQQGNITGRVIILIDVTRDRELTRLKDRFISTAAHELHTPLTSIIGYTELLLEAEQGNSLFADQRIDFLQEIYNKGTFLSRMVDELLDVSRIEAGQLLPLQLRPVKLYPLVAKTIAQYRQFSPHHEFALLAADTQELCLPLDPEKIGQVLENLLSNAVKYSPEGGKVEVLIDRRDGGCQVTVRDQGIGMAADEVAKIFDRFYRSEKLDPTIRGLGLGMSISRQIVRSHGGDIVVSSRLGEGTEVSFFLPGQENKDLRA